MSVFVTTPVPTPAPAPTVNLTLSGVLLYPQLLTLATQALLGANSSVNNSAFSANFSCVTRQYNESCVADTVKDLQNIIWLGVPAVLFLMAGLVWLSRKTTEDGFVVGSRMIEADEPWPMRYASTALTYVVEGTQIAGLAFGPASVRSINAGPAVSAFLSAFFFNGGHWETTFIAVLAIYGALALFMMWPMVQYWTLDNVEYKAYEQDFVFGNFGRHTGVLQDIYMLYFTVPAFVAMLIMVPCEYYETGEPATAVFRTAECNGTRHQTYAIVGGVIALLCFLVGTLAGTVPIMTMRKDSQLNLNGRFLSLNFMIKACLAIAWVLFRENHQWIHLCCVLIGQCWMLYLNVGLRPCLVERINFHRSSALCLALVPTITLLISSALSDKLNVLPTASGGAMAGVMFVMLLNKYYIFPCGKLFPAIPYQPPAPEVPSRRGRAIGITEEEEEERRKMKAAAQQQDGAADETTAINHDHDSDQEAQRGLCAPWCTPDSEEMKQLKESIREPEGEYEGGLILGQAVPQGQGMLRWGSRPGDKVWGGTFFFGRYHGYGVMTHYKYFFQGMHFLGSRHGFGVTNQLEGEDEDFYEGNWVRGEMSGVGTKQFLNNDTYDGSYLRGVEHGAGIWSFDTALGRHSISAKFKEGALDGFKLDDNEVYEGQLRFGVPHGIGRMEVDGNVFEGEWRAGKLHGNGKVTLVGEGEDGAGGGHYEGILVEGKFHEDGTWRDATETYTGKWVHGQKHGTGIQILEAGTYEGMFVRDVRTGFGTLTYKDGTTYNGSWYNNIYHGAGTLTSSDGAQYEGFWAHGKRHGPRGTIRYPNGEQFYGDWDEDEYHGEGVLKVPNMGEYHGRFQFSKREGNGRFTFFDGSEYVGSWADDLAHGHGKFVFSSRKAIKVLQIMSIEDASKLEVTGPRTLLDFGGVYEGDFEDGSMNGTGAVKTGDGTLYEGEWAEGLPQGHGKMAKPSGHYYEGEFFGGNAHGKGRMTYPDDRLYIGDFVEGKRQGQGILYDPEGVVIYDCDWVNDVPDGMQGDVKETVDELRDIPAVDIDDLMRVIMPSSQTPVDIDQQAFRRRLEIEERWHRFAACIWIDEERLWRHTVKHLLHPAEAEQRKVYEQQALLDLRNVAKSNYAHILNQWKIDYRAAHGSDPKKSDLLKDPSISGTYKVYMEMSK